LHGARSRFVTNYRSLRTFRHRSGLALLVAVTLAAAGGAGGIVATPQADIFGASASQTAGAWLEPPPVLTLPSRAGPEGPPRPFGVEPSPGPTPAHTDPRWVRAQDHTLLYGPFPRGGLIRGISDSELILSSDAEVREQALARIRATGANVVRIPVEWRYIVSSDSAAGFDAADPGSPAYDFTAVDAAVRDTAAAGLTPLLVVTRAPAFAEAPGRWPYAYPGSWAPHPAAFGEFATAVARRYSGAFPDPLESGRALPRVRLLEAWNEPNLARYLEPQWVVAHGRWIAFSPLVYRQLLNAFYTAIKAVEPSDVVIAAGVAPNGDPTGVGRMTPVRFLRTMLCLEGGAPGSGSCPDPAHFDVLAFHPLSFESPDHPAASSQDVAISDITKVTTLLAAAEHAGTALPRSHKPVWVTELNWESDPPSPTGVPASLQPQWISRALHRLWVAGVGLADWQFLIDPYPGVQLATPTGGTTEVSRPAGLYSAGPGGNVAQAQPKPFLTGFTFPFDPLRLDRRHVRVWALLTRPGQPVMLQRQNHAGRWRTIVRLRANAAGVLNALLALTGRAELRLQSGSLLSAPSAVPSRQSRL
jgi:Cellulase (glycosyl hydrolase family 5)